MNRINNFHQFKGRVGKKTKKRVGNDRLMVNISMAIKVLDQDDQKEWKESTQWVYLTAFGKIAERIKKYVKVGALITAWCNYRTVDKEDENGNKRTFHNFVIYEFDIDAWPRSGGDGDSDDDDDDYGDDGDDGDDGDLGEDDAEEQDDNERPF